MRLLSTRQWQEIELLISNLPAYTNNFPFKIKHTHPVSGGDVNQAFCISDGITRYFVKVNNEAFYPMFEQEAEGLAALVKSKCALMAVPSVIGLGAVQGVSYLVLEYLDFANRCDEVSFAKALANLHLAPQQHKSQHHKQMFGFEDDNYIGRTLQINRWHDNWGDFFTNCRLKPQLDILRRQGRGAAWMDKLEKYFAQLSAYLNQHKPQASLLHGDLWQGNYGNLTDGRPTLYDPAVYYGDSETDLAMMMLFGRPSKAFFECYSSMKPIDAGFEQRRVIYNLYHILNHANLFGDSYLYQAESMVGEVLVMGGKRIG